MSQRIFTYKTPKNFIGHKISEFLKSVHFSEKILAALRQDENSLKIHNIPVCMNQRLEKNSILSVCLPDETIEKDIKVLPVKIDLHILFEDEDLLVINKPADMPIHPSRQNYEHTLGNAVAYYYQQKGEKHLYRCINRLDKDTSGLTIIAKNRIIAGMLYHQMQNRQIYREYTAIVQGSLSGQGTIDLPIGKDSTKGSILRFIDTENGQRAVTHYTSKPCQENLSLVRLHLDTGRTHQIRVHMKEIGHPLIGDRLYNPDNHLMNRQALHAGILKFTHPYTGEYLTFMQEPPADMEKFIKT